MMPADVPKLWLPPKPAIICASREERASFMPGMFPAGAARAAAGLTQTEVTDYTGTTNIGSMTGFGGLAAAFDGNTSQAATSCARAAGGTGTIGKAWAASKKISGIRLIAPNNSQINGDDGAPTFFTANLRGSTDNFSSSNVDLGSQASPSNTIGATYSFLSGWTATTAYAYHRVSIISSGPGTGSIWLCELTFYEDL